MAQPELVSLSGNSDPIICARRNKEWMTKLKDFVLWLGTCIAKLLILMKYAVGNVSWKVYLSRKCVATRICIGGVSRCSLKLTKRCGTGSLAQSSDFFSTKYFKSLHIREVWQKKAAKLSVCHL